MDVWKGWDEPAGRPGYRLRWERFQEWRTDLVDELRVLPKTLREFREGVANFRVVSERLARSTEGVERVNELYASSIGDTVNRVTERASAVQRQLDTVRGRSEPEARRAVEELTQSLAALADLNPLWRAWRTGGGR